MVRPDTPKVPTLEATTGGTDGAVGGDGVGFDEDGGFHIVRSLELAVRSDSPARWAPPLRGGRATARCQGLKPLVMVGSPLRGWAAWGIEDLRN